MLNKKGFDLRMFARAGPACHFLPVGKTALLQIELDQ